VADIDPGLISQWQASPRLAERVAARLAMEICGCRRWDPVDTNFSIAVRLAISEGTVRRAKLLLASCGAIMKDAIGRSTGYYVS
jgi:hypothetical protein